MSEGCLEFYQEAFHKQQFFCYGVRIFLSHFLQSGKYLGAAVIQGTVFCNDNDLHLLQMEGTFHDKGDHTVKMHKKNKSSLRSKSGISAKPAIRQLVLTGLIIFLASKPLPLP